MADSSIEWTDKTWNPTTGCTRVSPGCKNCYAFALHDMRHAAHLAGKSVPKQYAKPFKELQLFEDRLDDPLHWRAPKRVFVNSMSDLFHKDVPDEFIARVWSIMRGSPQHTFQILTKRPERMTEFVSRCRKCEHGWITHDGENLSAYGGTGIIVGDPDNWPLRNVWLGTSVENQAAADERIPHLLRTPAAVRFLSCEPLLGPVDLSRWLNIRWQCSGCRGYFAGNYQKVCPECGKSEYWSGSHIFNGRHRAKNDMFPVQVGSGIDWIIAGCESGRGMRTMRLEWAESLAEQCKAASVNFFMKQMVVGNGVSGDVEAFPLTVRVREFPKAVPA